MPILRMAEEVFYHANAVLTRPGAQERARFAVHAGEPAADVGCFHSPVQHVFVVVFDGVRSQGVFARTRLKPPQHVQVPIGLPVVFGKYLAYLDRLCSMGQLSFKHEYQSFRSPIPLLHRQPCNRRRGVRGSMPKLLWGMPSNSSSASLIRAST
jgi:hypothetical protein